MDGLGSFDCRTANSSSDFETLSDVLHVFLYAMSWRKQSRVRDLVKEACAYLHTFPIPRELPLLLFPIIEMQEKNISLAGIVAFASYLRCYHICLLAAHKRLGSISNATAILHSQNKTPTRLKSETINAGSEVVKPNTRTMDTLILAGNWFRHRSSFPKHSKSLFHKI